MRIFHIATESHWAEAQRTGAYTTSTIGVTLEQEGYLHASREDQWEAVRDRYYADVTEPLLLLEIETDLLDVPWVEELPAPSATETFPHIYGPLKPGGRGADDAPQLTSETTSSAQPQLRVTPAPPCP